jgi:hypothetical protein
MQASTLPLNHLELLAFLQGWLPGAFDIPTQFWTIRQFDLNLDVPGRIATQANLRISVSSFLKVGFAVYQKADELVRMEARVAKKFDARRLADYFLATLDAVLQEAGMTEEDAP